MMTTDDFDDLPRGNGKQHPTVEEAAKVYFHVKRTQPRVSLQIVSDRLIALGFKTSKGSVGRYLQGVEGVELSTQSKKHDDAEKRAQRRKLNNRHEHKKDGSPVADAIKDALKDEALIEKFVKLLENNADGVPVNSSAQLAIMENRARMALNVVIAHQMSRKPELLLLDMRGSAALVDALTVASKLSGGAALDISRPAGSGDEATPQSLNGANGHDKEESGLATDLMAYRRERAAKRDQRA